MVINKQVELRTAQLLFLDKVAEARQNVVKKGLQSVEGFRCAVLYFNDNKYRLMEIKLKEL